MSENQRQMCLTSANNLTYNSMKAALKRIFSDKISISKDENYYDVFIKQEEPATIFEQNKMKKK